MNCKPGDMAVLTKAVLPENVGLIVTVLQAYGIKTLGPHAGMFSWECKPAWPRTTVVDATGQREYGVHTSHTPDAHLRPIRPPETPVTETRDEELTV